MQTVVITTIDTSSIKPEVITISIIYYIPFPKDIALQESPHIFDQFAAADTVKLICSPSFISSPGSGS